MTVRIEGKTDYETIYEKIRLKTKLLKNFQCEVDKLKNINPHDININFLTRSIWELEKEIKELNDEFRGKSNHTHSGIHLSFEETMDYIGFLSCYKNNFFKIKDLMNSINLEHITEEQKEKYFKRKKYLENLFQTKF